MFRSLYRVRPLAAFFICLPSVLLCGWYSWRAFADLDAYRRHTGETATITPELFQIKLFDLLRRDLRATLMRRTASETNLDVFQLDLDGANLTTLFDGARLEEKRPNAQAKLHLKDKVQKVRIRLRGRRHWHLLEPKKSFKLQLPKGKLYEGHRIFNLIANPGPMVVGEQLILDYAKELGVLTPESKFARLRINATDLGVVHFEAQPDESLLRNNQRFPGGLYSGNLPPSAPTESLWSDPARWKKVSSRTDDIADKEDKSDLERLLTKLSGATHAEFFDFVQHEVNSETFATFDLLDAAFGGDQHDFRENHKYYFDPARGRWEPVAWNFRGFKSDPLFNLVENPITLRLKLTPGYLTQRDQRLYQFLTTHGSPSEVERRGRKMLERIAPDLSNDAHWASYRQLSRVDGFHRRMMRPLNLERAALVFHSEMTTYRKRHSQLLHHLEANPLFLKWSAAPRTTTDVTNSPEPFQYDLDFVVDGRGGARLQALEVEFTGACDEPSWELRRDQRVLIGPTQDERALVESTLDLIPAVKLVERDNANPRRGDVRSELQPLRYTLQLQSQCQLRSVRAQAEHLATGARIYSQQASAAQVAAGSEWARAGDVPALKPGTVSAHPWELPRTEAASVVLGPGTVSVNSTRVYPPQTQVTLVAGTHLKVRAGASIVFLGPVSMDGTAAAPIVIEGQDHRGWGGVALLGPDSAESQLQHVVVRGGSTASWREVEFGGMFNLYDTHDVTIRESNFMDNRGTGDVVSLAYASNIRIADSSVSGASSDAWDLEFSEATLQRTHTHNVGDDGIDTMGSDVTLSDSTVVNCAGNGLSAGEQSRVAIRASLLAENGTGVLAKNESSVDLANSVVYASKIGIRTYTKSVRYAGDSTVSANGLHVVATKTPIKRKEKKKQRVNAGMVQFSIPPPGAQQHLLRNVLKLKDWSQLAPTLAQWSPAGRETVQ